MGADTLTRAVRPTMQLDEPKVSIEQMPDELIVHILASARRGYTEVWSLMSLSRVCKRFRKVRTLPVRRYAASRKTDPCSRAPYSLVTALLCCACPTCVRQPVVHYEQVLAGPSPQLKLIHYPPVGQSDKAVPQLAALERARGFLRWIQPRRQAVQTLVLKPFDLAEAMAVLTGLSSQLQCLRIVIHRWEKSSTELQALFNTLSACPSLQRLIVHMQPRKHPLSLQWLTHLPNLVELRLPQVVPFSTNVPCHALDARLCLKLTYMSFGVDAHNAGNFGMLTNLQGLTLDGSTASLPWGRHLKLSALVKLTSLTLQAHDHNCLSLAGLTNLRYLTLGGSRTTSLSGSDGLHGLVKLELWDAPGLQLQLIAPALKSLTSLGLFNHTASMPDTISHLSQLKELYLSFPFTSLPPALSGLACLTFLGCFGPRFRQQPRPIFTVHISRLTALSKLREFEAYWSEGQVQVVGNLEDLAKLPHLTTRGLGI